MTTFYVSLTRDLFGSYLAIKADSQQTVRTYLQHEYYRNGEWRLPWYAVYTESELALSEVAAAIPAKCGALCADQF